jgi:ectoine hydroxylase-related dioxygenase (phytanoyl-CoA dioxygenase family)
MATTSEFPLADIGVFSVAEPDGLAAFYHRWGYAILRDALAEATIAELEVECRHAQEQLISGRLDGRHGTTDLIDTDRAGGTASFANYVLFVTELSPTADQIVHGPAVIAAIDRCLGVGAWSGATDRFGFVYQDARPGPESRYKRIGWHSDWQSAPHLDVWPSTAVTVHVDGTGPDNGFLRVVPGSHHWATPAPFENVNGAVVPEGSAEVGGRTGSAPPFPMPLRFEKVPGEVAVYAERGDILFHDCYLWHSAAAATDEAARRRHVRGSWFAGARPSRYGPEDFVKNAAR